jgi:hypothetical protein
MYRGLIVIFSFCCLWINGQQNQQLYFMHYLPESNFLNPAVQNECKWFIGLPVISSVHLNYANSIASYRNLFPKSGGINGDRVVKWAGQRSIVGAEFHTTLLALGYQFDDNYLTFTVIEKINAPITVSKQLLQLGWKGNSQFEGEDAGLKGTAAYITHYREYAIGYSKTNWNGDLLGIKAKLLFGKLNVSTPKTNPSIYTDPTTFNLRLHGEYRANISAPVTIIQNGNQIDDVQINDNASVTSYLLNRKNWGFAIDLGIIHEYNENITLAASILDLGFIRWRTDLNNLSKSGDIYVTGVPFDSVNPGYYIDNLISEVIDSTELTITHNPYFSFLPVKMYAGAQYTLSEKLVANGLLSATIYKSKFLTGLSLSLDYNPFNHFHIIGSYSLMYRSLKIVGLGFSAGKGPLQFYIISDNVCGFIWPLSARNINLRFGLNINLGCETKSPKKSGRKIPSLKDACKVFDENDRINKRKAGHHR